jgi:predicted metal-binding membrane protein
MNPAMAAARAHLGLIALLFGLAALAWWSTADRTAAMAGMGATELGALGWFVGVWVVMMAAMMLPSAAPTVALYARLVREPSVLRPLVFTAGYLLAWTAAGVVAYGLVELGRALLGEDRGSGWIAGATLLGAAAYELTPAKDACLSRCRSPLGFLLGSWRDGAGGALRMGAHHGAWCVGCCWALMAALFALGVMSLAWMAFVAALIALEKTVTAGGRAAVYATALLLGGLGVAAIAV